MAKKKKQDLNIEEKLAQVLVPEDEQHYKVPNNWVWVRLGSITRINPPKSAVLPEEVSFVPMAAVSDINGKIIDVQRRKIDEVRKGYTPFIEGDVLFAKITPCMENGKAAIAENLINGVGFGSTEFYVFRPFEFLFNKLLYHILRAKWFRENAKENMAGAVGQQRVKKSFLTSYHFPLPPIAEQQRIVDRIEILFAKLDLAKELAQNVLETFETRKVAILHKAFAGELTAKWREQQVVGMDSWEEKTLKEICKITSGGTPSRQVPQYYQGNIPWVKTGEIVWNYIVNSEEKITQDAIANSSAKLFEKGTVLVAMYGQGLTRGRAAILNIEAATNQAVCALIPSEVVINRFLYYYFMCNYWDFRAKAVGGNQPNYSGTIIGKFKINLPTYSEQQEIVRILDSLFEKEQKAKELCDVIDKIDLMKKAILALAFRGELGTNDPSEESAIELLKDVLMNQ